MLQLKSIHCMVDFSLGRQLSFSVIQTNQASQANQLLAAISLGKTRIGDHLATTIFFQLGRKVRQIRQIWQLSLNYGKTSIGSVLITITSDNSIQYHSMSMINSNYPQQRQCQHNRFVALYATTLQCIDKQGLALKLLHS